jgi:hypothetical protein
MEQAKRRADNKSDNRVTVGAGDNGALFGGAISLCNSGDKCGGFDDNMAG